MSDVNSGRPEVDRPNVLLILLDDVGFGGPSVFGGPCETPHAERLAAGGVCYPRFHVCGLCAPTRQALLTGRNHHAVGMGFIPEMARDYPGYSARRPPSAATLAQILGRNGYATAAIGKWHQTPPHEVGPLGPFDRWPTHEGFDHFYGFMGAEMDHWSPLLYDGTRPVEPARHSQRPYHLTEDLIDHATRWIELHRGLEHERPFFLYLAPGACHAPLHVAPPWREKYRGRFEHGWDEQRDITLARQKQLGIVPDDARLAPWPEGVPRWSELTSQERQMTQPFMETFAGFAEHTDAQIGRLIDRLADLEVLADTLTVYVMGDNGASGEGGRLGMVNSGLIDGGLEDDPERMMPLLDELGGPSTFSLQAVGWTVAMNTPLPWMKAVASHHGGNRNGMIVHWPNGPGRAGSVNQQWHHVVDVLPTILEAAGIEEPQSFDGVPQEPTDGVSMIYSLIDQSADGRRSMQYFEIVGNRGIYHDGWMAVARHRAPWEPPEDVGDFDDDRWELYNSDADWSQSRDIAELHPERLARLQQLFEREAGRNGVFPLDDGSFPGEVDDQNRAPASMRLPGHASRLTEESVVDVKNRSHLITASVLVDTSASGVIVSQGGRFGGWAFHVIDGLLTYTYNFYGLSEDRVIAGEAIAAGRHLVTLRFHANDGIGAGGRCELEVDGRLVGAGLVTRTIPWKISFHETLDVGDDCGTPVTDYGPAGPRFGGEIDWVQIDASGPASEDAAQKMRRAIASQ